MEVTRMAARIITTNERPARRSGSSSAASIVYLLAGLLEAVLAFRLLFKLLGANPASGFVNFIYDLTEPLVSPFYGIFGQATTSGVETAAVFEPATIIAMLVYGLVAWLIVRLISAAAGRPVDREV